MRLILTSFVALFVSIPTVYTQTTDDVLASNHALTQQADTVDASIVAITADTDPATTSNVPSALGDFTNAISSALTSLTGTPPTADPAVEANVVDSWGLFSNTIQELMDDLIRQEPNLIGVFGLQAAIYDQLLTFNTTFEDLAGFMIGVVSDASYQGQIERSSGDANGTTNGDSDGIFIALRDYA